MPRRRLPTLCLSLLGMCGAAPSALAQTDVPTLRPVDVLRQAPLPGLDIPRSQYPANAQQATDADMRASGADNLPEFMNRRLTGVSASDVLGSPFQVDITYRGQQLSSVLGSAQGLSLYLDGVRMNQPFGDIVNWDLLPEAAIDTITLVPGSNPLYGLNTLAGALVLTTKSGFTHPGTEAQVSISNRGARRFDFGHGQRWANGWHAYVAGTAFDDRGWRERSPGTLSNVFLKWGRVQDDNDWTISLLGARSALTGNSLLNESLAAIDRTGAYTLTDHTHARDLLVTIQGNREIGRDDTLSLLAWQRNGRREAISGDISDNWLDWLAGCAATPNAQACTDPNDPGFVGMAGVLNRSSSRQDETGAGLQWTHRAGAHKLALGTETAVAHIRYDQFVQDGMFDATRNVLPLPEAVPVQTATLRGRTQRFSLYASDVYAWSSNTQLLPSIRWNTVRVGNAIGNPAPGGAESFRYNHANPALGITHALTPALTLFGSASQGTRVPTALELGCADPAQPCVLPTGLQSDPFLKQVVSRTIEVGARGGAEPGLEWSAAVFRTDNRDDIVFVRSGVSQAGFFTNIPRTRRQGLELSLKQRRTAWDWVAGLTLVSATYQSSGVLVGPLSTAANPNTFRPGTPIAGIPRRVLQLAADWRPNAQWTIGADLRAASSQVVSGNESGSQPELGRLPGYAIVHAHAAWSFRPHWQLVLRIQNLFDRRYAMAAAGNLDLFPAGVAVQPGSLPQPERFIGPGLPRTVLLSLRYAFDQQR
jgi:outer membrane receptor protein involved in Fe transport